MHGHPVVKWSNLLIWYFGRYEEEPSLFLSSTQIMSLPLSAHLNDEWQFLKVKPCGYSMMHTLLILAFLWVAHHKKRFYWAEHEVGNFASLLWIFNFYFSVSIFCFFPVFPKFFFLPFVTQNVVVKVFNLVSSFAYFIFLYQEHQ